MRDEGTGPAIVLLHAFPCDGSMWDEQAAVLRERGWRTLVPDLPGFGESELPEGAPDLARVVRVLIDDLRERGVERHALAGLSLGGYVCMEWLRVAPASISGLALIDTKASADSETAAANRERIAAEILRSPAQSGAILAAELMPLMLAPESLADEHVAARVRGWLDAAPPESAAWYLRAMAARPDSHAELAAFTGPALLVRGELDALSGQDELASMQAVLTHSRAVVIPRVGHLAATESPAAVSAAMEDFVTELA